MRALDDLLAGGFRLASHVRGARAIHTKGVTVGGSLVVRPQGPALGTPLLDEAGEHPVVVRWSRSVGLPDRLPDITGLAIRVLDVDQDLLLDSASRLAGLRHLPLPRVTAVSGAFTSLFPYEIAGERTMVGAFPLRDVPRLADVPAARPVLTLAVSGYRGGWRPVAELRCGDVVPEGRSIRFTVGNDGAGMVAAGPLQDARRRTYPQTHVGPDA